MVHDFSQEIEFKLSPAHGAILEFSVFELGPVKFSRLITLGVD